MKSLIYFLQSLISNHFESDINTPYKNVYTFENYYITFFSNIEPKSDKSFAINIDLDNEPKAVISYDNDGLNSQYFPYMFHGANGQILHIQLKNCVNYCNARKSYFKKLNM